MTGVLVVEDDPLSMECGIEMLTACGFTAEKDIKSKSDYENTSAIVVIG